MIERYSIGSDKKPKLEILCLLCAERLEITQFLAHVKSRDHVFQFVVSFLPE